MDNLPHTVLIPAAGSSQRFKDAGILKPKGLLEMVWQDRKTTMIEHCIPLTPGIPIRVACRSEDLVKFHGALCHNKNIKFIAISTPTRGQAHTCVAMSKGVEGAIIIINSDNGFDLDVEEFISACDHVNASAGAVVFVASGERKYGYVSDHPFFDFGIEKSPISAFALAGMFYFKSAEILQLAYSIAFDQKSAGEEYLSQLFGVIPHPKFAYRIPKSSLHEWGTPLDLLADTTVSVTDTEWLNRKVPV